MVCKLMRAIQIILPHLLALATDCSYISSNTLDFTGLAYTWIESYLSQRFQKVIFDGKHSHWVPVKSGIPESNIPLPTSLYLLCGWPSKSNSNLFTSLCSWHQHFSQNWISGLRWRPSRWSSPLKQLSKTWHLKLSPWAKCKTITFTLRTSPIDSCYLSDGHQLERCTHLNDLGVILVVKLTFRDHEDACVSNANRMLGLLMHGMQASSCISLQIFDYRPVICAYYAHVRSVLEYGSVIWGDAAASRLARLEASAPPPDVARC